MKKITMHVMLIALTLFLIACNPETDNKDKTEDVKTSLSFSLSYEGIKELNDFSVEISISKEKDHPIDTFTLTNKELNKSVEVEEGEYLIIYRLLSGETEYSGEEYEYKASDDLINIKEGESKNIQITICPYGSSNEEEEPELEPNMGYFSVDLCNYFGKEVNYEISSYYLSEPLKGVITENTTFIVPLGYINYKFSIDSEDYVVTPPRGAVDHKVYEYSKRIEKDSKNPLSLYVYSKKNNNTDPPVLIFNPYEGVELLGNNNQYGDDVSIICTVIKDGYKYTEEFTEDSSFTLIGTGSCNISFSINAVDINGNDVSDKYEVSDDLGYPPGSSSYVDFGYEYYHLKVSRKIEV